MCLPHPSTTSKQLPGPGPFTTETVLRSPNFQYTGAVTTPVQVSPLTAGQSWWSFCFQATLHTAGSELSITAHLPSRPSHSPHPELTLQVTVLEFQALHDLRLVPPSLVSSSNLPLLFEVPAQPIELLSTPRRFLEVFASGLS